MNATAVASPGCRKYPRDTSMYYYYNFHYSSLLSLLCVEALLWTLSPITCNIWATSRAAFACGFKWKFIIAFRLRSWCLWCGTEVVLCSAVTLAGFLSCCCLVLLWLDCSDVTVCLFGFELKPIFLYKERLTPWESVTKFIQKFIVKIFTTIQE